MCSVPPRLSVVSQARIRSHTRSLVTGGCRLDKKLATKLVDQVPHPFTSMAEYQRSIAQPIGKEWNTVSTFAQLTKPRVSTKAGTIIAPVKATAVSAEGGVVALPPLVLT